VAASSIRWVRRSRDVELELGSTRTEYLTSRADYLLHHSGNPRWVAPDPCDRAITDRDGRFAFDRARIDGPSVVAAWSPTRGAAVQAVPERADEELVLVLPDHG
jgi:hypothetical protein